MDEERINRVIEEGEETIRTLKNLIVEKEQEKKLEDCDWYLIVLKAILDLMKADPKEFWKYIKKLENKGIDIGPFLDVIIEANKRKDPEIQEEIEKIMKKG